MAKGIKKIEWAGKGEIAGNFSVKNPRAKIKADQFVYFKIAEWHDGTTAEEKKGTVLWHFQTYSPRKSVLKLTKKGDEIYGIKLAKKFCGPFTYYLQTSLLNSSYSKSAGLLISGWCEPKIISSAWATESNGEDVRKTYQFTYGEPLYLNLTTEGLNGANNLIIEIYRRVQRGKGANDDQLIKVYSKTPVNNGEVNIIIKDSLSWQGKITNRDNLEQFYIKVKDPSTNKYIKDDNNDVYHARYLKVKNENKFVFPKIDLGLSKAKVGKLKTYDKNAGTCKFTKIGVAYQDETDLLFDEGKFLRKMDPKDNFNIVEQIHYDYDKWDIRNDAKPVLDKIADYLKEPPFLPVELGAHTDSRGTEEYNLDLSAKRADAAVKYLISKGVPSHLISGKGYGKTKPVRTGANLSEAQHQENRRTTLRFKIFENNAQTLVYDVVVPSYKKPAALKINIDGFIRKGCHKKKEHLNTIKSFDSYEQPVTYDLTENKPNSIDVKLNSRLPTVPKITDFFNFGRNYRNIYSYYLHSCTYYSGTQYPSFAINAYPDIVWIGHFLYNYKIRNWGDDDDETFKDPYFFHDIKTLELKNGIEQEINELTNSIIGFILNFVPGGWLTKEVLLPYMQSQAKYYDVGLHAVYDRKLEKTGEELSLKGGTELDFIKTDTTTRRIVAFIIYEMVAIGIAIDLIMLYLTRGGSAEAKVVKVVAKAKKISDYAEKIGAELVPPSIAINTGGYYKMQADRRMALIFEANIKADPLVAINFKKHYTIKSLLHSKLTKNETDEDKQKENDKINGILSKMGKNDLTLILTMSGEIALEQNIQYNLLNEQYSLKDKFSSFVEKNNTTYSKKINGTVHLEGDVSRKFFEFSPLETKVTANVTLDLACEAIVITEYGFDKKNGRGLFMTQKLKFSGLKGTFKGSSTVQFRKRKPIGYSPNDGKPIDFTVLEGYTQTLKTIYLFSTTPQK
ncbi:OmpA family protein [Flavobacterium chungangense]|uniref:Peptidoglycan-associated lipoprotein n=1 Tax=Flavobacterium chungangense TaxID=554283 RepID=A0A6V6YRI3_9FLAO|nr:OmpA family protein [Flavobacterium chungangense]CAD0002095.1 Peptidoglycan-associated lipoprotein [Flavobacterium chungangense]